MAYVLGFFAADGSMYKTKRGSCYIEFQITDGDLLDIIRDTLGAENKISIVNRLYGRKALYRLQMGSRILFEDLLSLGMTPDKSKRLRMPNIPNVYFPDFLRGYFDGDGNIIRTTRGIMLTRFTSGSFIFLQDLQIILENISIRGSLYPNGANWQLGYAKGASRQLFSLMYYADVKYLIYLRRKYIIFHDAFCIDAAVVQPG